MFNLPSSLLLCTSMDFSGGLIEMIAIDSVENSVDLAAKGGMDEFTSFCFSQLVLYEELISSDNDQIALSIVAVVARMSFAPLLECLKSLDQCYTSPTYNNNNYDNNIRGNGGGHTKMLRMCEVSEICCATIRGNFG